MNKGWDQNDFQGKSEKNYQTSYRILACCIVIGILVVTWGLVISLVKMIF
jgi:uncharacterized Tic20 family protein